MANITEVSEFTAAVPELATNTQAIGGPGGAMNSQAQALANRTKYLKDVLDTQGVLTPEGRADANAIAATAGADLATRLQTAASLGDSATKNVGTGAGDVAAGNAPAGAVTTHESTYAHANLPTAAGKTAADAIGAATGATTALKISNLAEPASATQQGVITKVTNAAEVTAGTTANAITPATLKDSTPPLNGIKFPATQVPSADANTLDDYEEGTWTPSIEGDATAGTQTYGTQLGWYTKIGNKVHVSFHVAITAKGGTMAGNINIGGLPFTPMNTAGYTSSGSFSYLLGLTNSLNYTFSSPRVQHNYAKMPIREHGSGQATKAVSVSQIAETTSFAGSIQFVV